MKYYTLILCMMLICNILHSQNYNQKDYYIQGSYDYKCAIQKELPIENIENSKDEVIRIWYKDYVIELKKNKIDRILVQTSVFKKNKDVYKFKFIIFNEIEDVKNKNDSLYFVGFNWFKSFKNTWFPQDSRNYGDSLHLCNLEYTNVRQYYFIDYYLPTDDIKSSEIKQFLDTVEKQFKLEEIYQELIDSIKCGYAWQTNNGYRGRICP